MSEYAWFICKCSQLIQHRQDVAICPHDSNLLVAAVVLPRRRAVPLPLCSHRVCRATALAAYFEADWQIERKSRTAAEFNRKHGHAAFGVDRESRSYSRPEFN